MINETDFTNTVIMLQIEVSVLDSCMDFIRWKVRHKFQITLFITPLKWNAIDETEV